MSEGFALPGFTAIRRRTPLAVAVAAALLATVMASPALATQPDAVDDAATTDEDTPVVISVLANDTDPDPGDTLTVTSVGDPVNGTASTDGTTVTYTPFPNFNGTDSFTYTVQDPAMEMDTATVTITVNPTDDSPDAVNDFVFTFPDTSVMFFPLGNDSSPDGPPTITMVTDPPNGTAVINGDGTITYTPDAGFIGTDSFDYTITDPDGDTDTATVTVTVELGNSPPNAVNDAASTSQSAPVKITVLANDSDPDDDALTISSVTPPAHGTALLNADQTITYTPDGSCSGTDSFDYTISDGNGGTDTATVTVAIDVDEQSTIITLTRSAGAVNYKQQVTVTGTLGAFMDTDNQELSIFRTPHGGTKTLIAQGPVDSAGKLAATVTMFKRSTFVAEWEGDDCFVPGSSAAKVVNVHANTTGDLDGWYKRSGTFFLFHDEDDPAYTGFVAPNHEGDPLRFVLQRKRDGAWRRLLVQSFTMGGSGARSSFGVVIQSLSKGIPYRIRAVFDKDADHLGDKAPWSFFKLTN
jgi:hypothetical protein